MKTQLRGALRADRGQHEQQGRVRQPAWPVLWAGLLLSARHHNKQPSPRVTHTPQRQIYPDEAVTTGAGGAGGAGERANGPGDEIRRSKSGAPAEEEGKGRSYQSPLHGCLPRADAEAPPHAKPSWRTWHCHSTTIHPQEKNVQPVYQRGLPSSLKRPDAPACNEGEGLAPIAPWARRVKTGTLKVGGLRSLAAGHKRQSAESDEHEHVASSMRKQKDRPNDKGPKQGKNKLSARQKQASASDCDMNKANCRTAGRTDLRSQIHGPEVGRWQHANEVRWGSTARCMRAAKVHLAPVGKYVRNGIRGVGTCVRAYVLDTRAPVYGCVHTPKNVRDRIKRWVHICMLKRLLLCKSPEVHVSTSLNEERRS